MTENGILEYSNDIEVEVFDKQGDLYDDYSVPRGITGNCGIGREETRYEKCKKGNI